MRTDSKYAIIESEKFEKPEGYPSFIMNIIKEGYPSFIIFIIKEGYPSGFSNFSDSIIAYFESVLTIFLLLTDSQFLKKTRDRSKLYSFNNFKLDWKQVDEKNFEMFHDSSNDKIPKMHLSA